MATTAKGTPYVESSDLVANYPGVSLSLANHIDTINKVLQVVSVTKTDTFTAAIARGVQTGITGLSAAIVPAATTSKILLMVSVSLGQPGTTVQTMITLLRGATAIGVGDAASARQRVSSSSYTSGTQAMTTASASVLDSPATTSSITYSVNVSHGSTSARTVNVNRNFDDGDFDYIPRGVSTITLMEISA